MAGKGGARPGAGRKKGAAPKTIARKAIAERILVDGDLTPLDVMIDAMREAHMIGNTKEAASYAAMAAPYVHPRLATVNANHKGEITATINVVSEFPDV